MYASNKTWICSKNIRYSTIFDRHLWIKILLICIWTPTEVFSWDLFTFYVVIIKKPCDWSGYDGTLVLTRFSPMLHFIQKPPTCFAFQNKWLVSIWNASLGWNGFDKLSEIFPNLKRNNASSHLHLVCSHIYERVQNPVVTKSPHCGHDIQNVSAQGIYVSI